MATYALYRHVELDRVGLGKKRVLKPPGGGSSFSFDGDDDYMKPRAKVAPVQQQQQPPKETPKVESNGTETPQTDSSVATKEPTPAPTTNGTPAPNGTATNGTETNGTATATNGTPASPTSVCSSPSSARLDTQSRLFGEASRESHFRGTVRDHQRSNIFAADTDVKGSPVANGAPKPVFSRTWTRRDPVTGVGVLYWDIHAPRCASSKRKAVTPTVGSTPESKTPEQPQPQQKQRIPPGGFSTKLW